MDTRFAGNTMHKSGSTSVDYAVVTLDMRDEFNLTNMENLSYS